MIRGAHRLAVWVAVAMLASMAWCAAPASANRGVAAPAAVTAPLDPPPAAARGAFVPAASDGEHAWIILERSGKSGPEHVLLHHATGMGGAFSRQAAVFRTTPAAIAADHGRVWIVMEATPDRARRDVYATTAARNPATGTYYYEPAGRLELLASLPPDGEMRGLVAIDGTCYALRAGAALERLGLGGWERVPGAPGLAAAGGTDSARLVSLAGRPAILREGAPARILEPDGSWRDEAQPLPAGKLLGLVPGARRAAALVAGSDGTVALAYARPEGASLLATIAWPAQPWSVVGLGDGFVLLLGTGEGGAARQRIDALDGSIGGVEVLVPQPSDPTGWIHLPILGMVITAAILAAVLLRNAGPQGAILVPEGRQALPVGRRLAALGIDLLPGIAVAMLCGAALRQIAIMPLWTTDLRSAVPGLIALGAALAISTLSELAFGTSLGKRLVGGEVVVVLPSGARPRAWQVLARNIFKGIILIAPIAGIFTIAVPGGRGIGEVASRTAVVLRPRPVADALKRDHAERR